MQYFFAIWDEAYYVITYMLLLFYVGIEYVFEYYEPQSIFKSRYFK